MDARLLGEHAICSDCPQQVHDEIFKAPMSWMLYLSNVLQLVIHRFYYSTLTEQKLVGYAHQGSFQKPKNQPMEHLPLWAIPLNVLCMCILWFLHTWSGGCRRSWCPCTCRAALSWWTTSEGLPRHVPVQQTGCMRPRGGTNSACACRRLPNRSASDIGN